ncbi:MAG: M1 family metallopeptidase [Anaerolineales bacterium]
MFLLLLLLIGCSAEKKPSEVTLVASPKADASTSTPTPKAMAAAGVGTDDMASATPTATPTPVPLPEVCLRPQFSDDDVQCGDVPHYDLSMTISLTSSQVFGHEKIRYTNIEGAPLDEIYLRLYPNAPSYGGEMSVSNMTLRGRPVTPTIMREGTALHLPLTPALEVGEVLTMSLDYTIQVPTTGAHGHGLFSHRRGVMSLPTAYAMIAVYDEGWHLEVAPEYSDDVYADAALYQVWIDAPADTTLVASGVCSWLDRAQRGSGWSCEAGPMREFVVILGDYRRISQMEDDVVINSYVYPTHEAAGQQVAQYAADALRAFSEYFGPYPYTELDVVETPNYLGGMEYPGLVVVEDNVYVSGSRLEWLTAHEVAHQWWFGVVGSDPINEPWLDEALTQYSTMLYYEAVYGEERAAAIRTVEFQRVHEHLQRSGVDTPAGLPASEYGPGLYWSVVYDRGALYFHNLREELGDDLFFEFLRTYYQQHRYQIATPDSFLATLEEVTGSRHLELFETWIGRDQGGGE